MKNRPVKKIGNSWFIKLAPIDHKDYHLEEGDMLDIETALLLHTEKQKGGKRKWLNQK